MLIAQKEKNLFYSLFFVSGMAALFYQLVWQRALFTIYGLNMESVTVIVSGFILGLGIGSLIGGWLSKKVSHHRLLLLFSLIECVIGLFGYASLSIFNWLGEMTIHSSNAATLLLTFALVCLPALFMGMTLPILVNFLVKRLAHVGHSVSNLYFVNTLGSGIACFLTVFGLMKALGQSGLVHLAATFNVSVAVLGLLLFFYQKKDRTDHSTLVKQTTLIVQPYALLKMCCLAALSGFIALSYEIIWIRFYGFASGNNASVFAQVLAFYLTGIAFGALFSRYFTEDAASHRDLLKSLFFIVFMSSLLGFLLIPLLSNLSVIRFYGSTFAFLGIMSVLLGMIFPVLCHCAIQPNYLAGSRLSYVYFSNIVGATFGSFLTGFVLLDIQPLSQINLLLGLLGIGFSATVLWMATSKSSQRLWGILSLALVGVLMFIVTPRLFDGLYEKLHYRSQYHQGLKFAHLIENKAGIIAVDRENFIFGNNIYDGGFFISPLFNDKNGIFRAFSISAFIKHPSEVLMIGLSSGSWAQVLANHPEVKHITIVEINPGYLKLIPLYPVVASLLHNPKVNIIIDDGRRWLRRHPDKKFDLVVMNTTFHWREYASNLLSANFLNKVRLALKPGGVLFYNTTGSTMAVDTASTIYPAILRVGNFIAVSDLPIVIDKAYWKKILLAYQIDQKPLFNLKNQQQLNRLLQLADLRLNSKKGFFEMELKPYGLQEYQKSKIITDDNMGDEWRL